MDRREFLFRARQELSKRSDALFAATGHDFVKSARPATPAKTGAFFFRPEQVEDLLRTIRARLPEQTANIVERANKICSHRFDLLGYESLDYGPQINWHLDAVHQKIAPKKFFYKIQYLDFAEVGDSKVTWELNRHQHFVTLAKAYRLTGDERFAQELFEQWRSWHLQNPYPIGINWASSLEVAFRSLSWIWTHAVLEGTNYLTPEFHDEYLRAQALNGRHIERYLSTYFSPNTHLLGEGVALFFLGTMCPELHDAERWKSRGWQIVLEQAAKQVNPDGMHFEQSVYYHVYALDFFIHAALLASANGMELPKKFEQTIERMMNALYLLGRAGPPPRFGDDDGGRLFDPSRNRDEHLLDPLSTGAILFQRGDYKSVARELREETIWLLGEQGLAVWDSLELQPVPLTSVALDSSGIYVMPAPQAKAQLIVKAGPSVPQTRGHAHADALSVCLQASGRALLIDPGAYEYVGDEGKRGLYRGTAMHNTVTVDGLNQAEPEGPFSWQYEISAKTERWIAGETFDMLIGSHRGYSRLPNPVTHRRCVFSLKSGPFLVRDLVEGEGQHRIELSWRLAPDLQMHQKDTFRMKQSAQGLAVLTPQKHGWSEEVHKGPWSPVYGAQRMTTVLKFGTTTMLPAEFVTLLVPLANINEMPGRLTFAQNQPKNSPVSAYVYQADDTRHEFFLSRENQRWIAGRVTSDAEFVCITAKGDHPLTTVFSRGTYVGLDGKEIVRTKQPVDRCEVVHGESAQIFCSEANAIASPAKTTT